MGIMTGSKIFIIRFAENGRNKNGTFLLKVDDFELK